jgi:hypothetical protein
VVTVLGRLTAAELLAVLRACMPLHLAADMGAYFRGFAAGLVGGKVRALTDDELRAVYATVRHLRTLAN